MLNLRRRRQSIRESGILNVRAVLADGLASSADHEHAANTEAKLKQLRD